MGCCVSTNNEDEAKASSTSKKDHQLVKVGSDEASKSKGFSHENRAPPPSAEEETVKEVLSETPKPKQKPIPKPDPSFTADEMKQDLEEEEQETTIAHKRLEAFAKLQEKGHQDYSKKQNQNLSSNNEEVMSEVSEICSVSMSESMSTMTNTTDKRDNEEEQEVRQQQRGSSRSPAKPPSRNGFKRERVVNQSPTRRSDQSPGRIIGSNGSARLVQSSRDELGRAKGRRGLASDPVRRDPGESSGRRSGSPATTRSSVAMGRSPSAKRANRSPSRVKTDPVESSNSSRKVDGRNPEGKWAISSNCNINNNCSSTNESLENPLVSLECFIFL